MNQQRWHACAIKQSAFETNRLTKSGLGEEGKTRDVTSRDAQMRWQSKRQQLKNRAVHAVQVIQMWKTTT